MTKTYEYFKADDVLKITGTGLGSAVTVGYDDLHRVTTFTGLSGYAYDPIGNLTTSYESGSAKTYVYGSAARLEAVKTVTGTGYSKKYLYDKCGNMIVRQGDTTGSQALDYDSENRLTRFSQAGTTVVEYGYADDGARLWKRVNQDPNQVQVWIGKIYEEKIDAAVPPVKHTLFHVFAGDQQVCTFEAGSSMAGGTDPTKVIGYYYHEDNLNSSSALSSSSGSQLEVNVYYPFGRTQTDSPQASFQVSRRFTGQILDAESGLYYYNARYYDPELGRFIQPDTEIPDLSNPQSYNRYSYVLNNPLRYTDPSGHEDVQTSAAGRAALLAEDADAAGVVQRAQQSAGTTAHVLRFAAELNPVVGAANGGIGAYSRKDAITGEPLTTGQRWKSGVGAVLAVAPFVFKVGGKVLKVGEEAAEAATTVKWSSYGGIHVPSSKIPWKTIVEATTSGAAKYAPGVNIEKLERAVWEAGVPASNGKPWKVAEFTGEIGASGGKSSRWVRVEESGNAIHGHPITQQEFRKLTKKRE